MTQQLQRDVDALLAFIGSRASVPHAWGDRQNDCIAFAIAAIEAQTGQRIAPRLHWHSERGALRLLKRFGSIEAALDAHLERIAPAMAMRGDIAGVSDPQLGLHPMVVEGDLLVGPGETGTKRAKRSAMVCAWSATRWKASTK